VFVLRQSPDKFQEQGRVVLSGIPQPDMLVNNYSVHRLIHGVSFRLPVYLDTLSILLYCLLMDQYKGTILLARTPDLLPPDTLDRLREAGDGREVRITAEKGEILPLLDSIEIGLGDFPFSLIPRIPHLTWIQLWSAGADWLEKYPEVKNLPFRLTTTSGMHGPQLAEHIFGLLLAWNRCFRKVFAAQDRHEWLRVTSADLPVLPGKTMLILGFGAIGEDVARAAMSFGMRVIGLRRHAPAAETTEGVRVETAEKLPELLPSADVVVNILPHTPDTKHLFGRAEFAAMKRSALYVNAGRGATTDEEALIEALRTGGIAGALLDVTEKEPLPPDSPLWGMENVILTGHYGGLRAGYDSLALDIALDNLGRYVRGEPLKNLVDKGTGY
jgi:phosphoglycerate dehydrogenase-like enzyme